MTFGCQGCPTCTAADRAQSNIDRARDANVVAVCVGCGKTFTTSVADILTRRGMARCCPSRRKQDAW